MNSFKKNIMRYISLNVLGMIGLSCYILVDTFFVSKALGTLGLAALNFSISIFSLISGIGLMIGIGGATEFSVNKVSNPLRAKTAYGRAIGLGMTVGVGIMLIGVFWAKPISQLLGADSSTLAMTQTYLTVIACFAPCYILNYILTAFIRNDGNPKLAMTGMLASSFSNIILDYVFMFPLKMGMFGAAFATGIAPIISMGFLATHFLKKKNTFHLTAPWKGKDIGRQMRRMLGYGFSSFVGELASSVAIIAFNLVILGIEGNVGVAAYGVVANVALVFTSVYNGVAQGIQPVASEQYGIGRGDLVRQTLSFALKIAAVLGVVIYVGTFAFDAEIVNVFNNEGNRGMATLAEKGIDIYFLGYFFAGINIVAASFLSAITEAQKATTVSLLRSCLVLVPALIILSRILGMTGVWLSFVVTEALVGALTVYFLAKCAKKVERDLG